MDQSGQQTPLMQSNAVFGATPPEPIPAQSEPVAKPAAPVSGTSTPFTNPFASAMAKTANSVAGQFVSPFANTSAAQPAPIPAPEPTPSPQAPSEDALAKAAILDQDVASVVDDAPNIQPSEESKPDMAGAITSGTDQEPTKMQRRIQNDAKFKPTIGKKYVNWKKVRKIATICGATVAGILVLILAVSLLQKVPSNKHTTLPYDTDKVFVRERSSGGSYALFNKYNGAKVTDFDYATISDFIDGYALVSDSKGQPGVINDDGEETIPFGEYATITGGGGAYIASVKDSKTAKILLGSGKQIAKVDNSAGGNLITAVNAPFFIFTKDGKKYSLYNARGDKIKTFESTGKPNFDGNSNRKLTFVRYGDHVIVLDSESYKIVAEVDYPESYEIDEYSSDKKFILLKNREEKQALIAGGTYHTYDKCNNLRLNDNVATASIYVVCNNSDNEYTSVLIDENGELTDIVLDSRKAVFDVNNYAVRTDKMVEIFHDGEKVREIMDANSLQIKGNAYAVGYNDSKNGASSLYVNRMGDTLRESVVDEEIDNSVGESLFILRAASSMPHKVIDRQGKVLAELGSSSEYAITRLGSKYAIAPAFNNNQSYLLSADGTVKALDYKVLTAKYIENQGILLSYNIQEGKLSRRVWSFIAEDMTTVFDKVAASKISNSKGVLKAELSNNSVDFYSINGTKFHTWSR